MDKIIPIGILITLIATILTFIVGIVNIIYTRKNLTTSKFIEVITSERIKWLDVMRTESSNLISWILNSLEVYKNQIEYIESEHPTEDSMNTATYEYQKNYFNSTINIAFVEEQKKWTQADLTRHLHIFKLRLNPKEDQEILAIIDYFINLYSSKYISDTEIKIAEKNIISLTSKIQILLKNEWEKVKKETKGKR
jgi:hypothetical protein